MKIYIKLIVVTLIVYCVLNVGKPVFAGNIIETTQQIETTRQDIKITRLAGQTKFETAKAISEFYSQGKVQNVVISTGNGFADALSASVLAHEKKAPILLVDYSVEESNDAFEYIVRHLDVNGTVYIIGGTVVINQEFETKLNTLGFYNIIRIAGYDRYETSYQLAQSLNNTTLSTVVIASGVTYPDALSIAGVAANKGWPILLTPPDALPQAMKNYLADKRPSTVYLIGGEAIISENVQKEISTLLSTVYVERLAGQDRFDTNVAIAQTFNPFPSTFYLASGYGFADALAGSVLAAQKGEPIILLNPYLPTLPKSVAGYMGKQSANNAGLNLISLGGTGVIKDETVKSINDLISGTAKETSIYSIENINATVTQNKGYSLPQMIPAKLYNSDTVSVPVKWNSAVADTGGVGSYVYEGVVDGYEKIVKLNLTVNEAIPIPLSQYSTRFDPTQVNRTDNIRLAANTLKGKVLAPGERFSFNKIVGERTVKAGYKEAMIIEGDAFVLGLGGGICQVSSTLYNAVLLADLEIIERHPHSLPINYVPPGKDATVSYPYLDFKFRNSTNVFLLINSLLGADTLTFQLFDKGKM